MARAPFRSACANAACERLPGSLRRERLDWLIILGERHLVQVLREYFDHYNRARGTSRPGPPPARAPPIPDGGVIVRKQRLHGLINEYSRAA